MQRTLHLLSIGTCAGLAVLFGTLWHLHSHPTPGAPAAVKAKSSHSPLTAEDYGRLPLSFESNQGQVDPQVAFLSHGPGYSLFLTSNEAVLALHTSGFGVRGSGFGKSLKPTTGVPTRGSGNAPTGDESRTSKERNQQTLAGFSRTPIPEPRTPSGNHDAVLRLKLLGANQHPRITGVGELPGSANYFIGNDRRKWRTQVPTFGRVEYKQVYPGIDMVYYGNQKQLEYDWVVAPGADVHQIQLGVKGAEKATLTDKGDLMLHTDYGDVIQHAPIAYQQIAGLRKPVSSHLVLLGSSTSTTERRIGFAVEAYDHTHPLVIDPVLIYSTYFGGSTYESGNAIAADSSGNAYITGYTSSLNFPISAGSFQSSKHGSGSNGNAFVSAMNASGTALLYSTYLGGSHLDGANGIAVDGSGNAYVTGTTESTDFPITSNAFQSTSHSISTGFVTKLNSTGTSLIYSTYLGGTGDDWATGIAINSSGDAYVTGYTSSTDFPTSSAFQATSHSTNTAFVTKLNSAGTALIYSTYLGGSGGDSAAGIAVDPSGNAYVTGQTSSTDFPTTGNAFQPGNGASISAFVTRFNATGTALIYSTYLGGSDETSGSGIAVDSSGNAYVTGYTISTDFPLLNPYQNVNHSLSSNNAFVTKLNSTGSALIYSTYLGGSGDDRAYGIAIDASGDAYVIGETGSSDFPVLIPTIQQSLALGSSQSPFIVEFSTAGSTLVYSTYLGGSGNDDAHGIAVDSFGNTYVIGTAYSVNFPVQNPYQPINRSGGSSSPETVFIAKIGGYNWQAVDVAVGSDNRSRLLWVNTTQTAGLWSVNADGQLSNLSNLGPFTGYTVQSTAAGADGYSRLLWTKTSGVTGLWLLNANNTFKNGFNFGPYTGWSAVDVAVGSDNKTRLLWTKDDGTAGVWTVDNNGTSSNLTNIGPFAGWTASRIAAGSDGYTRLLWTKDDGTVGIWLLNANNTYRSGFNFGPFTGWRGIDLAVGSDNKTRLLWTKDDGTAGVWTVDNNGVSSNLTNVGPFTGWTASRIAAGADGLSRLLWFKGDGTQGLWLLNANNSFNNGFNFGPY